MESKVPQKVALVGCGWFACEAHLPALKKLEAAGEIEIAALCSLSSASIARGTAILGRSVRTFSSLPELLDAPGIDVVDLTLPIPIMAEAVRASLIAGKHVISEKPCAGSLDAARALVAFHEQLSKPCVWAVAENWRFKRSTRLIQEIVANRVIGDVTSADFKFVTRANGEDAGWRNGGNFPGWLLLDSGVHFIAMLRQVVGEICSVSGNVTKRVVHHAGFDSLAATLRFADGADGMLRMSFSSADAPNRCELELVGTTGTLTADFMASSMTLTVGRRVRTIRFEDDPWIEGGVHDLLAHCFASIRTGVALIPTPREAMSDVAVIEALFEASRSGQRIAPATLPLSAPHVVRSYERLSDFRAKSAIDCNTVDEVRQAVGAAASAGLKIRPRGNCLSWAPHLATRDASITIRGLNRIIRIDEDKRTVQVEAGTRLGHLTRELALHGLTVPSLSFLTDQTIGGAIATATHGTNVSWGTLSDFVESVTLVLPSGDVRKIGPGDEQELKAARTSVGMLGMIVSVELRVVPIQMIRFRRIEMTLDKVRAFIQASAAQNLHAWGKWRLGTDLVAFDLLEPCSDSDPDGRPYIIGEHASWTPPATPASMVQRISSGIRRRIASRFNRDDVAAPPDGGQVWTSMQYAISLEDFEPTMAALLAQGVMREHAGRDMEFKFLAGSRRTFLGPNVDGDTALLNLWWQVDRRDAHDAYGPFENFMMARKARPHWGKMHKAPTTAYMKQAFPEWNAFEAVRNKLDPDRVFTIFAEEHHAPDHRLASAAADA